MQPFGRLTRDESIEGSGLALATAFANLHDGALRLEGADPDLRSTIELPLV